MSERNEAVTYVIDEIFTDLGFYKEPELLKQEFQWTLNIKSANLIEIEKYLQLLSNINYAWRKTLKYKKYFSDFYVQDKGIENFEALNHHIHAYLQDADTLKNKIKIFLDELKKDLKNVASNKKDVVDFVDAGIEKTYTVFKDILNHRKSHVHNGTRFTDGDLFKAEMANFSLETFSNPMFDKILNQKYKPELIKKLEKEKI